MGDGGAKGALAQGSTFLHTYRGGGAGMAYSYQNPETRPRSFQTIPDRTLQDPSELNAKLWAKNCSQTDTNHPVTGWGQKLYHTNE